MTHYTLYADGGARGNPGPAGAGAVVRDAAGNTVAEVSEFLGHRTNNFAEYEAVILALAALARLVPETLSATEVAVKMDSELVIKQMQGVYKVKHPVMKAQYARLTALAGAFRSVTFTHVPRAANKAMDRGA